MSLWIVVFDSITSLLLWTIMLYLAFQYAGIMEKKRNNQLENTTLLSLFLGKRGLGFVVIFATLAILFVYRLLSVTITDSFLELMDLVPKITALLPIGLFPLIVVIYLISLNKLQNT